MATVRPVELATGDAVIARRSRAERAKLRRELSRLDTILFLISAMVVVDTIGAIAIGGGQAFTWLVVLFAGALTSLLYWAGTPMWLGGAVTVAAMSVQGRFFGDLSQPALYAFGTVFIGLATVGAVVPLRYGKWLPITGAVGQIGLLAFFTLSVVRYGAATGSTASPSAT